MILTILLLLLLVGCGNQVEEIDLPLRDNTPVVLQTVPSEEHVEENDVVSLYLSNVNDGYIMLTYKGTNEKVQFQIKAPNDITYTYTITECHEPTAFPLTAGTGSYVFTVYESINPNDSKYSIAFSYDMDIEVDDEFNPYLLPNVYVDFIEDSACVAKGMELAEECYSDLDVVENVYEFVINTVIYDLEEAKDIPYGYIPNPDEVLSTEKGICFDYASLMTAMLRSQSIPTRLEVGYAGEAYHAWISCYVDEIGWVSNIIEFDGENWSLMDPTLASNNDSEDVQEYIGDGSKYVVKYTY